MSLAKSNDGATDLDWMELAAQVSDKLMETLEQLGVGKKGLISPEKNNIGIFREKREVVLQQLQTILDSFSVPDLINIPAKTQVTNIVLAQELKQELEELQLLKENLNSNVGNLKDLIANRNERDTNLKEIIHGLKQATEAVEDDNDEEELENLRRMKHSIREVLNTILDEAYPQFKSDVKKIIQELYEVKDEEDPYIQVPEDVDLQAVMLLLSAKIITQQEGNPEMIRLMF